MANKKSFFVTLAVLLHKLYFFLQLFSCWWRCVWLVGQQFGWFCRKCWQMFCNSKQVLESTPRWNRRGQMYGFFLAKFAVIYFSKSTVLYLKARLMRTELRRNNPASYSFWFPAPLNSLLLNWLRFANFGEPTNLPDRKLDRWLFDPVEFLAGISLWNGETVTIGLISSFDSILEKIEHSEFIKNRFATNLYRFFVFNLNNYKFRGGLVGSSILANCVILSWRWGWMFILDPSLQRIAKWAMYTQNWVFLFVSLKYFFTTSRNNFLRNLIKSLHFLMLFFYCMSVGELA